MDSPKPEELKEVKEKKKADPADTDRLKETLDALKEALIGTDEDVDQVELIKMIQKNRAFVLEFAMSAYLDNPKNGHLLEGVTAILTQIEKVVRDDRKERLKKKENEDNAISFNQMMEAIQNMNNGSISIPTFDLGEFILDPSKSLMGEKKFFNPISEHELGQGIKQLDFDGNEI